MMSCWKSLVAVVFAITLMLSLAVNTSQARVHPSSMSSTISSAAQDLEHSNSDTKKPSTTRPLVTSLQRIPPSVPNPIQNK
ncbi:type i inositol polyphosphate 5-phosphatase 10 [Fagus crenata]